MGQSPFANVELLDADEEERIRRAERYELIDVELDTYLVESAKVLVDYKYFTNLDDSDPAITNLVNQDAPTESELLNN